MNANNHYRRKRPEGWAERRRYFRRLAEIGRPQAARKPQPGAPEPATRD